MDDPHPIKSRKGVIDYNYDEITSRGKLERSKTPIYVDQGHKNTFFDVDSSNTSVTLVHDHLLPCIVNGIVTKSDDDVQNLLYHNYTHTLQEYVVQNAPLVCTYTVPALSCPVESIHTFDYINDVFRYQIRGAIRCICYLHKQNLSITNLELETNFVIHEERLKLYRLTFCKATAKSKKKDFVQFSKVLDKLFADDGHGMPDDVKHLTECMRQYCHSRKDYLLLSNHLAVLRTNERLEMIRNFYERRRLLSTQRYNEIFYDMDCVLNWTTWFDGSEPGVGPAQDCYNHVGEDPSKQVSVYFIEGELTSAKVNRTAIRFARDMVPHLPDHMSKHLPGNVKYTQVDLDLIIMHTFVDQLLSFQETAHCSDKLKYFL